MSLENVKIAYEMTEKSDFQNICCVCVKSDAIFIKSEEDCEENPPAVTFLQQLRDCFPDLEWEDDKLKICIICYQNLQTTYNFRMSCIRSIALRKQYFHIVKTEKQEIILEEPNLDTTFEEPPIAEPQEDPLQSTVQPEPEIKPQNICTHCGKAYKNKLNLVEHIRSIHTQERPYMCDLCGKTFTGSRILSAHKAQHDSVPRYVCPVCGRRFPLQSSLYRHKKIHENKREYKCDMCDKTFNTASVLRNHKVCVHSTNSWRFVCEICTRKFPTKWNYEVHMRSHKNEKPFECHICNKKLSDKHFLQKHILSHSTSESEKGPHVCDVCKKEYKYKPILANHLRKVHGIKDEKHPEKVRKYLCHLCPKTYIEKNKLTKHLCLHKGEKKYTCEVCEKKFVLKSYLRQHMKIKHNMVLIEDRDS